MKRTLLLAGAAAAALAGCGGQGRLSKPEYERQVQALYADVQQAFRATDVPRNELSPRLASAEKELDEAAAELLELRAPREVVAQTAAIATGLQRYADDLEALRGELAAGRPGAVDRFNASLRSNDAIEQISEAAEQLKFSGYDLGDLAED
jgi:hypothetical protein